MTPWFPTLRSFGRMILVMLLPVLVPVWLIDRWLVEEEALAAHQLERRLDCDLQILVYQGSPREIFLKAFHSLFQRLAAEDFTAKAIRGAPRLIPGFLQAQVGGFTSDGELVVPDWARLNARTVIRKFWDDVRPGWLDLKRERLYRALFGPQFIIGDCNNDQGYLHDIGPGTTDGALIWKSGPRNSGLLAWFPEYPRAFAILPEMFRRLKLRGFYGAYDPEGRRYLARGRSWPGWERALFQGSLRQGGTVLAGRRLCRIIRHPEGFWLMRSAPIAGISREKTRLWLWGFALLFTTACAIWWGFVGEPPLDRLGLGSRTAILFIAGLVIPGILLVSLGSASFRERTQVLEQEVHTADLEKLRETDFRYRVRRERYLEQVRRLRDHPWFRDHQTNRIDPVIKDLRKRHLLARVETRNARGEILYSNDEGSPFQQMMGLFCQEVLRRYLGVKIPRQGGLIEDLAVQILMSPRLGMTAIFDSPDQAFPLALGKKHSIMYWDVFPIGPTTPLTFFSLHQVVAWELERFFRTGLAPGVLVFDGNLGKWSPDKPPSRALEAVVAQALIGRRAASILFRQGDTRYLASAYPSARIAGLCFLTWTSLEGVYSRVSVLRRRLLAGALATLLLGLAFSQLLSRSLLRPIRHLAAGIEALERRQLTQRLPDLGRDELGALGQAMNELMAEMRDVDFAREIQRNLIPEKPLQVPGYEIAVMSRTATDLGGDYCDVLPLSGDKAILVTADVTGHGIAAALLTTMAKTICTLSAQENRDLPTLLNRLNRLIHEAVKKRKLITMVAGILDGPGHTLEWSCVGHTYPYLRLDDGTVKELIMPQYPLGIKANPKFKTVVQALEPGAAVFFYTDGLIEGLNRRNEMFGYDRMSRQLSQTAGMSATETVRRMFEAFAAHADGVPPNDDITLLLVRRKPDKAG